MPNAFSKLSLRFLDRLLPNVNVVPSRFWFPLGLPCLQVDPWDQEKKAILCYTPVISFLPSHANPHRVLYHIPLTEKENLLIHQLIS